MQSSPASEPGPDAPPPDTGPDQASPPERENAGDHPGGGQEPPAPDAQAEIAALEDRYKRALADLENYRKRTGREIERRVADCREGLIRDWLEAVDSVERALRMAPEGPAADGLRAVLEQMEAILRREGVQRIGATGEQFDPQRFEAVGVRPSSEVPDRTVVEVVRSGFGSDGHVLRPAQVIVADAQRHDGS
jgi:molecular chaperone GrpE